MSDPDSALDWAKSVQTDRKFTLAEIEAEVSRRPLPPAPRTSAGQAGQMAVAGTLVGIVAMCTFLAPAAGFVMILIAVTEPTLIDERLLRITWVVAAALPVGLFSVWLWYEHRRRHRLRNLAVTLMAAVSAVALILSVVAIELNLQTVLWIAAALVTNLAVGIAMFTASRTLPKLKTASRNADDRQFVRVRTSTYATLRERGLVESEAITPDILGLAPGEWANLR